MSGDPPNDGTVKIDQNAKKYPGDFRWHVVAQIPVKDRQLILVWKKLSKE